MTHLDSKTLWHCGGGQVWWYIPNSRVKRVQGLESDMTWFPKPALLPSHLCDHKSLVSEAPSPHLKNGDNKIISKGWEIWMRYTKAPSARFYDNVGCRWMTIPFSLPRTDWLTSVVPEQLIVAFPFVFISVLGLDSKSCSHPSNRCNTGVIYIMTCLKGLHEPQITFLV